MFDVVERRKMMMLLTIVAFLPQSRWSNFSPTFPMPPGNSKLHTSYFDSTGSTRSTRSNRNKKLRSAN